MTSAELLNPPPRDLRPHQRDAVNAVDTSLARQQVIMACGTGKTLTGMHAVAKLLAGTPGRVLILVPTLTLLEQTYAAWRADAPFDFDALAVCSKLTSTERRAVGVEADADVNELSLRATTDPDTVAAFLADTGTRIVFATYQSLGAIIDAHRAGASDWNVIVCDEAHRTAGAAGKAFGRVLRDEHVPGDRRLFLTATPRVHTVATKVSGKGGKTLLMSMDDESVYGPQVYTLSVAEAVERGILSQYQVAVIEVTDAELSNAAQVLDTVMVDGHELNTDHVASIIALSKAARGIGLHSVIAYFNSRAASKAFVEAFQIVHSSRSILLSGGTAEHIDGNMKLTDRSAALSRLATVGDDGFHLVSNARCLTEGIDVPVLDGVLFGEPRSSQIDVVQCVGRAIRKNPRTDNPALIVLAVRTGDGQDVETAIAEAGFAKVRQVIAALGDHDPRIAEAARTLSRDRGDDNGGDNGGDRPTREDLDKARQLISLTVSPGLLHNGFGLRMLLNQDDQAWERWYAELLEYVEAAGGARVPVDHITADNRRLGAWASAQRNAYRFGRLTANRIERLEVLPGWVWERLEEQWEQGFSAAHTYAAEHGNTCVPAAHVTDGGFNVGSWVHSQRQIYREGKLPAVRIVRLEALPGWTWDPVDDQWERGFAAVGAYSAEHGNARVPWDRVADDGLRIGQWVASQRNAYRFGRLTANRIERLEALPGWTWNPFGNRWEQVFSAVKAYAAEHGHTSTLEGLVTGGGFNLERWVHRQRAVYRSGKLSADRIVRLEALPGWTWDPVDDQWERGFAAVGAYTGEHGHARVPGLHVTDGGFKLGRWVGAQRAVYREGKLPADRIVRLETLPGWTWDPVDGQWEVGFAALCEYVCVEGNARVPQRFVTVDGFGLGVWVVLQRRAFRAGRLVPVLAARLEGQPGWVWDPTADNWEVSFAALCRYVDVEGNARVHQHFVTREGDRIGMWVSNQRVAFRAGKLSRDRVEQLEALPGWVWDAVTQRWEAGFAAASAYAAEHGHTRILKSHVTSDGYRLGQWVGVQRRAFREGKLPADRVARLEALPGWVWNPSAK